MGMLDDVPDEKRFFVCDGTTIRNLKELETALKTMSNDTFSRHIGEDKNYFAEWVKNVIGDEGLANMIKNENRIIASILIGKRVESVRRLTDGKCPYLSNIMECLAGGSGAANCLDPFFHKDCKFREKEE